jgi:outer membrane protein
MESAFQIGTNFLTTIIGQSQRETMMMKRVLQGVVFGALTSVVAVSTAEAQAKIAYVNSQAIMRQVPGRAEAEAELDKERGAFQSQVQKMEDSMRVLYQAYEKDAPGLDSASRAAREKMIRERQEEFEDRAQALETAFQKKQADLVSPLMGQVAKVLDEIRAKGGYSMIFDVASGANVVVSADSTLDLTEQVIARLKELGPPKPTASAPASPGPVRQSTGVPPRTR